MCFEGLEGCKITRVQNYQCNQQCDHNGLEGCKITRVQNHSLELQRQLQDLEGCKITRVQNHLVRNDNKQDGLEGCKITGSLRLWPCRVTKAKKQGLSPCFFAFRCLQTISFLKTMQLTSSFSCSQAFSTGCVWSLRKIQQLQTWRILREQLWQVP